jgi:hypothetical protein
MLWKYVLTSSNDAAKKPSETPPTSVRPPDPPAPKPPPPIKLASDTPAAIDLKVSTGTIDTIEAARNVAAGDAVVNMVGWRPLAKELEVLAADVDRVSEELMKAKRDVDAAVAAKDQAKQTAAQALVADRAKSLEAKRVAHATKKEALDKLRVLAPTAGAFTPAVKPGLRVAAETSIGTLAPPQMLVAVFTGSEKAVGTEVQLAVKGGAAKLACRVAATGPTGAKVACPFDAGLVGAEVTLTVGAPERGDAAPK